MKGQLYLTLERVEITKPHNQERRLERIDTHNLKATSTEENKV